MGSLVVCAACARHIRRTEAACPFCNVAITNVVANAPERAMPATRLGRAALFAFAAASVGAAACATDSSDDEMGVPLYGGSFVPEDASANLNTGGSGGGGGQLNGAGDGGRASYGGPPYLLRIPPVEAGTSDAATSDASGKDADAHGASDASHTER